MASWGVQSHKNGMKVYKPIIPVIALILVRAHIFIVKEGTNITAPPESMK